MEDMDIIEDVAENAIDLTKTVPAGAEGMLIAAGVVLLSTLFIILFLNIKKNKAKFVPIFIGVAGYVVFPLLGYNIIASLLFAMPWASEMFADKATPTVIILSMVTALMFTLGRVVTVKVMKINGYLGKGNFFNAGIGLSLGNIVVFGLSLISLVVWNNAIEQEGLVKIFEAFSQEEAQSTWNSIIPLLDYHVGAWFVMALSYAVDILMYAALMWVDGCASLDKLPKVWHLFGGLMNFAVILPFDMYDGTTVMGYVVPFAVKFAFMAVVLFIVLKYTGEIDDEEVMEKNKKKMPKIGNLSKL